MTKSNKESKSKKEPAGFIKYLNETSVNQGNVMGNIVSAMAMSAILNNEIIYHANTSGYVEDHKVVSRILELRGYRMTTCTIEKDKFGDKFYITGDRGYATFTQYDEGYFAVEISHFDIKEISELMDLLYPLFVEIDPVGTVKMLAEGKGGYSTVDIGKIKCPLVRSNYTETVLDQYDHLVSEMASSTPCGRFSLLHGEPGTGKSFFLRGLISQVPKVRWLLIPSNLVGNLSGPAIGQVLLQNANDDVSTPLVLILEDADSSVRERTSGGSPDSMSDLLNLGDGILGEIADIRIIASTNATNVQLDKALLRKGRLCQQVVFEELSTQHWHDRWKEMVGTEYTSSTVSDHSLANIYSEARDAGWKSDDKDVVVKSVKARRKAQPKALGNYV